MAPFAVRAGMALGSSIPEIQSLSIHIDNFGQRIDNRQTKENHDEQR